MKVRFDRCVWPLPFAIWKLQFVDGFVVSFKWFAISFVGKLKKEV